MDHEWLRDFFIQFLKSPKWIHPISEFIDNECFIFDNEEENKFAYTDSHNKFKELVDALLTEHLREVAVTEENLENFCGDVEKEKESADPELLNLIAEQLLSVDDFMKFRAMMTKRNLEQQMEALRAMQGQEDTELDGEDNADIWKSYEDDLREALMLSEKETENDALMMESELQKAIALSLAEIHKTAEELQSNGGAPGPSAPPMSLRHEQDSASMCHAPGFPHAPNPSSMPSVLEEQSSSYAPKHPKSEKKQRTVEELAPVQMRKPLMQEALPSHANPDVAEHVTANASPSAETPSPAPRVERRGPTEEEKKLRAEHLKKQREMLLEKKRLEREKGMQEYESLRAATKKQHTTGDVEVKKVDAVAPRSEAIGQKPEETATQLRQALTLQLRQSLLKGGDH